jgi:hypothetical protein
LFVCLDGRVDDIVEAVMAVENWSSRWWETSVVLLAVNSVVFGFLAINSDRPGWAIAMFVPAVLLLVGLAIRSSHRVAATILLTGASVAAAIWFWMIYPVVLALVVVVGGFSSGKLGPKRTKPEVAVA